MKKFLMMALLLILPFTLGFQSGQASAEEKNTGFIQVQTVSYANGGVLQGLYFSANEKFLAESGATQKEIQSFRLALYEKIKGLKTILVENFALIYLKNPNDKFAIGQDGALQITLVYDQTNDAYGLQLYFKDKDTWDFYHPSSEQPEEARQEGFVTTEKSEGQIIFAQSLPGYQGTVGQYLKELYLSAVQGVDLSQSYNPILSYDYALSSSKIRSNADSVYADSSGMYHHLWQRTVESSIENDQIVLYYYQVHPQWWYLTVIGLAVVVVLGGGAIVLLKNRKKKKENNA